ncbi:MAG TPA: hypothetical protein VGF88_19155 [Acidobacteriaceae bacterium]|jgi:hypothetical protein
MNAITLVFAVIGLCHYMDSQAARYSQSTSAWRSTADDRLACRGPIPRIAETELNVS